MTKDIPMVHIPLHLLIKECNNGKKTNEEIYKDFSNMNSEVIHDVFKYRKFNDDFVDTITLYSYDDESLGKFRPCYYDFSTKLVRFLNCHYMKDDEELTRLLNEKVDELSNIKGETELKNKFHLIFDDLLNGRSYIENLRESNLDKDSDEYKEKEKYYYRCGLRWKREEFLKTQTEVYRRFVNKRYEYGNKTLEVDFNDYMNEYFDMDKVELIVLDSILRNCISNRNIKMIEEYKPQLIKFIRRPSHTSKTVNGLYGKNISASDVEILAVSAVNLAYHEQKKKNIYVNSELVKEGTNNTIKKKEPIRQIKMTSKDLGNLKRIANDKVKFYEDHPSYVNIIGLPSLKGYKKARVYENGEVILDTEYKNNPKGAAIYNFRIEDYDSLKGLTPYELKHNEKVKWIPHRPGWEEELEEIINREATEEDQKKVEEFIEEHKKR